jgi:hypothetical protein
LREVDLAIATPRTSDQRPVDLTVVEGDLGPRSEHVAEDADPLQRQVGRLREVQDHAVLVDPTLKVVTHELHPGIGARDVHDERGTGRGLDAKIAGAPQGASGNVEHVLSGMPVQNDRAVRVDVIARGRKGRIAVGQSRQARRGSPEVNHAALMAGRAIRNAKVLGDRPGPTVDDVAFKHLAVRRVEIAADDQVVAGPVRVGEMVADCVARDVGIATHGHATFNVAVLRVEVMQDERTVVVRSAEAGRWNITSLQG